jgi:hypothetical protein
MPNPPSQKPTTYVTRLTWNTLGWRQPSGPAKGENGTFVAESGFGHEEWLNRSEWVFGGWRYSFLQGVDRQRKRLVGTTLNIRLYTINPMKQRLYVGTLNSAEVIDDETATRALVFLRKSGFLEKMKQEVGAAGGKLTAITSLSDFAIANIRFRPDSLRMYQKSVPAVPGDRILRFNRYAMIRADSALLKQWGKRTKRAPWQIPPSTDSIVYKRAARLVKVDRSEAKMEVEIKKTLEKLYGEKTVEAQRNFRDIIVTTANRRVLIEIKASQDARQAIRDAFGQLLDYAYFDTGLRKMYELFIVGRGAPTKGTQSYLDRLRNRFGLEINYRQYKIGSHRLVL